MAPAAALEFPAAKPTPAPVVGDIRQLSPRALGWSTTSSTTTGSAASAAATTQTSYWGMSGIQGSILNWAAIAVVIGLLIAICAWRFATARHRSFRGFFFPKGLKISWLRINIDPPPEPEPLPGEVELRRRRREERFQRRRTRGDNIAEGGQRLDAGRPGDLDDDDEHHDDRADVESLPGYKADISAPIYLEEWRENVDAPTDSTTNHNEGNTNSTTRQGEPERQGENTSPSHQVMSTAEYEARIRGESIPTAVAASVISPTTTAPAPPATVHALRRPEPARMPSGNPPLYDVARQN